jgi:hypothetical protein
MNINSRQDRWLTVETEGAAVVADSVVVGTLSGLVQKREIAVEVRIGGVNVQGVAEVEQRLLGPVQIPVQHNPQIVAYNNVVGL